MNITDRRALACVCSLAGLAAAAVIAGFGPLNPPAGAVAPTAKTLNEVEPRIAINAANTPGDADSVFTINQSGSYYLTGDVVVFSGKSGIKINNSGAANVTIDLNGFTIRGGTGSLDGIRTTAFAGGTTIRVHNGAIVSMGGNGVNIYAQTLDLTQVAAEFCGVDGLNFSGDAITVKGCRAFWNTGDGFHSGSTVNMSDCTAELNTANGIEVSSGIVSKCNSLSSTGKGILGSFGLQVSDCHITASGDGITVGNNSTVTHNWVAVASSRVGIHATGNGNRIEDNDVQGAGVGVQVDAASGNVATKNFAHGCITAFTVPAGNFFGPVVTGSAGVATASPWANFSY